MLRRQRNDLKLMKLINYNISVRFYSYRMHQNISTASETGIRETVYPVRNRVGIHLIA